MTTPTPTASAKASESETAVTGPEDSLHELLDSKEAFEKARKLQEGSRIPTAASIPSLSAKLNCRMYENQFPEVNDLVMVTVQQVAEMGAYVTLLEYNNIEGMVLLSELSRRRIRSVQRLVRVGKNEVVVVLRVDREKGYIDLSKRRVSPEDAERFEEKFNKSKVVHSIMRHVAEKCDMGLEDLYKSVGWPLYRKFGHALDAFKLAITEPERVLAVIEHSETVPDYIRKELMLNITRRLTPQKVKLRADFEVACFSYEGIDAVKRALKEGEQVVLPKEGEMTPIKIRLVAPPLYVMQAFSHDKNKALECMVEALERIDASIRASGGQLVVKMRPKAVSELDDRDLDALMKKSELENAEVSGDEDASD